MSRHLEKILAHAERELTSTGTQRPTLYNKMKRYAIEI